MQEKFIKYNQTIVLYNMLYFHTTDVNNGVFVWYLFLKSLTEHYRIYNKMVITQCVLFSWLAYLIQSNHKHTSTMQLIYKQAMDK